jgi:CDP-4-dehydro-6-deoxyglucose reductase, E1
MTYPLATNSWGPDEYAALRGVIESDQFTMGERCRAFEAAFASHLGVRHCVMVNSGSSANLLVAAAMSYRGHDPWQRGDEVIVPALGWATTYYPFHQHGYRLRFCDVDPQTLNLDPQRLADAITPTTRGVCLVHTLGNPCDLPTIRVVIADAERRLGRRIDLIEDTCEAFGAEISGAKAGTVGLAGTFSFFFSHHISTMEGGMIATDDDEFAELVTCLRAHGWTRDLAADSKLAAPRRARAFDEQFRFLVPGYNVRPLELSAAVGLVQLARFGGMLNERRANARQLTSRLEPLAGIVQPQRETGTSSWFGFALTVARDSPVSRDQLVDACAGAGIATRPVITGNFTRQAVLRHIDHTIAGALPGADYVHDHGFYVGNDGRDLSDQIRLLVAVLTETAGIDLAAAA